MADSVLHAAICRESDSERGTPPGEEENTTRATDVQINTQIPFGLRSKELFVFRWILRLLSLWSPTSACFAERVFYPALINIFLLLGIAAKLYINLVTLKKIKDVAVYVDLAFSASLYLSHIFGVLYFKSRDLEDNMLNVELNFRHFGEFRKKLTRLKLGIILPYLFMAVPYTFWRSCEWFLESKHSPLSPVLESFLLFLMFVYSTGISWALPWTMYLFQQTCSARLQQLSQNYLSWTRSTEEAVYDHLTNYSRKVKTSCERLKIWFVIQNVTFIIAAPFVFVGLIKNFHELGSKDTANMSTFGFFVVLEIVILLAPLFFAEQLQIHDGDLCTRVNEFCPGTIEEQEGELRAQPSNSNNPNQECYTFHSRTEVKKFLSYLKNRKSGFLIGSFSFQLKLSMFSVFLAMVAFVSRVTG